MKSVGEKHLIHSHINNYIQLIIQYTKYILLYNILCIIARSIFSHCFRKKKG